MNIITLNDIRQNIELLFIQSRQAPTVLKNNDEQMLFMFPVKKEKLEQLVAFYNYLSSTLQKDEYIKQPEDEFDEFDKKWCGFLNKAKLNEKWRDEYVNELLIKYE